MLWLDFLDEDREWFDASGVLSPAWAFSMAGLEATTIFEPEPVKKQWFNPKSANHNNCRLLCLLPVTLKVIVANSVDPVQTAPLGAVWSGSTLFAYMQK